VGWIGTLLPIVLIAGNMIFFTSPRPDSVSGYYYTGMRNIFVGALCALGLTALRFAKSGVDGRSPRERARDVVYRAEALAVFASGVSWFVKGQTLLPILKERSHPGEGRAHVAIHASSRSHRSNHARVRRSRSSW
jgi:hypothetical protein